MSKEERGWLLVIFVSLCAAILLSIVGCKPAHKEHERMELEVLIFTRDKNDSLHPLKDRSITTRYNDTRYFAEVKADDGDNHVFRESVYNNGRAVFRSPLDIWLDRTYTFSFHDPDYECSYTHKFTARPGNYQMIFIVHKKPPTTVERVSSLEEKVVSLDERVLEVEKDVEALNDGCTTPPMFRTPWYNDDLSVEPVPMPLIHTPDDDLIHFNIFLDDEESDAQE